jgi:FkbM family methyltransferase
MLRAMRQQGLDFGTVIDGGANVGQFSRAVAEVYPHAKVIAFEALPDVAETLRRNLADRPQVRVVQSALGPSEGTLQFFPNQYSLASSALPVHANHRSSFPGVRQLDPIQVPMVCLDRVLADEPLTPPVLLKLDLQGYELEALKGAQQTLARTTHVLLETAFKPMYEGEPLFEELSGFMRSASFRFVRPIDFLADAQGEIVQMDALFTRAQPG